MFSINRKTVIVSRDVIFDENSSWNWEEEMKEKTIVPRNILQSRANEESEEEQPTKMTKKNHQMVKNKMYHPQVLYNPPHHQVHHEKFFH